MSSLPHCSTLAVKLKEGVLHLTLDRPQARNAMSLEMVSELRKVLDRVEPRRDVRAIVLRGAGETFCAGGDIKDMRSILRMSKDKRRHRLEDYSRAFGAMLHRLDAAPQVVIAAVDGPALGGGLGLVCAADVVAATGHARFGLPETTLGLVPSQVAPFLVRRVGLAQARRLALTGVTVGGREAHEIGFAHYLCGDAEALEGRVQKTLHDVLRCAPGAVAATKKLLPKAAALAAKDLLDEAAAVFADALLGAEGQEGTRALVDKHRPSWTPSVDRRRPLTAGTPGVA